MPKNIVTGLALAAFLVVAMSGASAKLVETQVSVHGPWKVIVVRDDAQGNQLNRCLMDIRNKNGEMLRLHLGFDGTWAISIPNGGNLGELKGDVVIDGPMAQTVPSTWKSDGANRASRPANENWIQKLRKASTLTAHYDGTGNNARASYEYVFPLGTLAEREAALKAVRLCWANNHK